MIWSGSYCQFGVEALIPVNARSGSRVGVLAQFTRRTWTICFRAFSGRSSADRARNSNPTPNNGNTNFNGK